MSVEFNKAFNSVIAIEGGFSDDPTDRGGQTKFGITERVARANGYTGLMKNFTIDNAKLIYKTQYWDTLSLDKIGALSSEVAHEMFDTGVNMGINWAGRFLQRGLNALNRNEQDWADLAVDGIVGPMTIAALRSLIERRSVDGEKVLLRLMNAFQATRYVEIAENDKTQEKYTFGWVKQRVA